MFEGVTPFDILMRDEYSDMNLVIGVNIIAVHQLVLASHSSFLHEVLVEHNKHLLREAANGMQDNLQLLDKPSLILPDASLESVTKMVHFLYSGELVSNFDGLKELRSLANNLKLSSLILHVEELEARFSVIFDDPEALFEHAFSQEISPSRGLNHILIDEEARFLLVSYRLF